MAGDWQKWQKQFRMLEEFRRVHPNRWPGPNTRFPRRNALGAWCARQQREYKRNNLSRPRLKKLLDLDFPLLTEKSQWERRRAIYTYQERGWLLRFEDLRAYRRKHPDQWPKTTDSDHRIRSLGKWLSKNRSKSLRPEFKRLLKSMGFDFTNANQEFARQWDKQFRYLLAFRKENPYRWPSQKEEYPKGNRLGSWVNSQRLYRKTGILKPDRKKRLRVIGFDFAPGSQNVLDKRWEKQFRYLQAYRKATPHHWPHESEEYPAGNRLGFWVNKQRYVKRRKTLSPVRERKLLAIGFDFNPGSPDAVNAKWEKQFRYLLDYRKKNPHRWPTQKEEYPKGNKLGSWISTQREKKRKGGLWPEQERKLSAIGFNFSPIGGRKTIGRQWEEQFSFLQAFRKENPRRWPTISEEYPMGNKLGSWVSKQRYKKKTGKLRPQRQKRLGEIGFAFDLGVQEAFDTHWEKQFRHLLDFRDKNPDRWPSRQEEFPPGNKLGTWAGVQRDRKRARILQPDRERKLRSVDFDFAPAGQEALDAKWDKQFRHLLDFRKKNPRRWPRYMEEYPAGNQLGRWITKQRQNKKIGKLTPQREQKLSAIGFALTTREFARRWDKQFRYLLAFRKENRNRWPAQSEVYPAGNKLGTWVHSQRQNKKKGTLPPDREKKLRAIGFDFNPGSPMP